MHLALVVLALLLPASAFGAEQTGPEFVPVADRKGVRLVIRGFHPPTFGINGGRPSEDVEREGSGVAGTETEAIGRDLDKMARAILQECGIPVLDGAAWSMPELLVDVSWIYDRKCNLMAVRVHFSVVETATRLRDGYTLAVPSFNVSTMTWATPESFRATLETGVRSYTKDFCESHRKAHGVVTPGGQPVSPDVR